VAGDQEGSTPLSKTFGCWKSVGKSTSCSNYCLLDNFFVQKCEIWSWKRHFWENL